jgi:hypothetical protein
MESRLAFAKDASRRSAGSFSIFPTTNKIKWGDHSEELGHIMDLAFWI